MSGIFLMVKRGTVFLLMASLLTRLFAGSEYKKYMEYAAGLVMLVLVAVPVLSLFGKETSFRNWFQKSIFDQKAEETKEEISMLGKSYEQSIWERYETQIRQDVAGQCGVEESDCKVTMNDGEIERIEVRIPNNAGTSVTDIQNLARRYGIDEDCIFLIEDK